MALCLPRRQLEWWIENGEQGLARAKWVVPQQERLTFGSLRGREATDLDNDRLADLWANAPEEVGDWEVTVERSPNAFAQFRLQENVIISVVEDRGVLLACVVWSPRNTIVGGKKLSIHCGEALRVRKECRGKGYGNLVRAIGWPARFGPSSGQFHYLRSQNYAAVSFFRHTSPTVVSSSPEREGDVPDIPVTVLRYPRRPFDVSAAGIRKAERSDLRRCVALINRTHRGLDLFRPDSVDFLELKLDERFWGRKRPDWPHVYGWEDYFVVEEGGRVLACAGLWDKGRDVRERWRRTVTGEERLVSATALMDFGFETGRADAMARLIAYFIGETDRLGRDYLLAPLQQLPSVAALLEDYRPLPETRGLGWLLWDERGPIDPPDPMVTRPYTDLAYW